MTKHSSQQTRVEALESRIVLSATPFSVGRALDLDDDITIVLSGNGKSIATQTLGSTGQFLGFPSGGDGDFLILSTGIASQVFTLENTGDAQGTDLGEVGPDLVSVKFTLPVPQSAAQQRLKLDFMFLTDEFPEFVGANFNDTFEVLINGQNFAQDEFGNPVEVDNAFFSGDSAPGTYFDGRTNRLTLTYVVPDGMTSIEVELRLSDVGDGEVDSAVLVDNVRFESPQVVYLDFDGANLTNHFGSGTTALIPGFNPGDLGSVESVEVLIQQIVSKLQDKFAPYDIFFTSQEPTSGDYTTLVVGGDNEVIVDISSGSPLLANQHGGTSVPLSQLFDLGGNSLLGFAGAPDIGNLNRNDRAVIFSGEFDEFFDDLTPEQRLDHLVVTLAHELGHNLGLRHLDDAATSDIMKQTAPRLIDATFGNNLLGLAEEWSDGTTQQNDHIYLSSVLGKGNASGLALAVPTNESSFSTSGAGPLFDVTITITTGDGDSGSTTIHLARLDSTENLPLQNLPTGAKISLMAASVPGGQINIFSGTPVGGQLTYEDSFVPLFGANDKLLSIPLAKGAPGTLTANGALTLTTNDLGADVTLIPGKTATFIDADGDTYTVKLTGPGIIGYILDDADSDGRGGIAKLRLDDTLVGQSVLSITVKKGRFGDGIVNFGEISGSMGAGLKSLTAPAVNLIDGGIVFSGALGNVVVRDLLNGSNLIGGDAPGLKSNVTARLIGDGANVALATDVTLFKAARIGNAEVNVESLAKLVVGGDKVAGIAGDVAGQFTIAGALGSVTVRDFLTGASIDAGGGVLNRTTLVFHDVMNGTTIALASVVTSLKAARIGDAQISAQQFDSISVTGDTRSFIAGDFGADLVAINKIGKFVARDILGTASIVAGGSAFDKTSFTAHAIMDGASIALDTSVSTFKAAYVGDVDIQVAAIASLQVLGDAHEFLLGDFRGSLTLIGGGGFFVNALGSAVIKGTMVDATIIADTIGTFNARGIVGSTINAGFTPDDEINPFVGGIFDIGASIKSLIVGLGGFADSFVATGVIGTITMSSFVPTNGGEAFGILVDAAPTKVSIGGFAYVKGGAAEQSFGDLHLKVV